MKIYNIVFLLMLIIVFLPICIYLKARDLGLSKKRAIYVVSSFLRVIPKVHFQVFNELKHNNKKDALKLLIRPIVDLPGVITIYSKSVILANAKLKAIEELLSEFDNEELDKFIEILKEENIDVKIKTNKRLRVKVIKEVKDNESKYSKLENTINSKAKHEQICRIILDEEIGATVKDKKFGRLTM